MSLKINIDDLDNQYRDKINNDLTIKIENKSGMGMSKSIYLPEIDDQFIYTPFAYSITELDKKRRERKEFSEINVKFDGELKEEQKIVKKEALSHLKTGSVIISCYTGFGKTILAINLACVIKLKTLIIINKVILIKQWEDSIKRFCPDASVQKLTTKSKITDSDFYIMNAINVKKMGDKFFNDIGLCIIDECHLIMAESLSKSLHFISPRYLIGLSATPYRPDNLDILLELYFGKNKIIRTMKRKHIIYQVNTGFIPKMEKLENSTIQHCSEIDICSALVDEIRSKIIVI
jgi:superfamily II DNA or RNA helicase